MKPRFIVTASRQILGLLSALTTEWLGIHSLFGAFFMGALMPKNSDFVKAVPDKLESLTVMALVTTLMTSPLLEWVYPPKLMLIHEEENDSALRVA